ncbi:MAG: 4Fe-4S dicluster domain-containing protein [Geobacteraceae bacterium]|nr:4Fe-4S dicluster domain-containing protein [Geobacteraceae bacterium]
MGQEPITAPPIVTDIHKCSGCGRCVAACPEKLYTLETSGHRKFSVNKNPAKCTLCGRCITVCPLELIIQTATLPEK